MYKRFLVSVLVGGSMFLPLTTFADVSIDSLRELVTRLQAQVRYLQAQVLNSALGTSATSGDVNVPPLPPLPPTGGGGGSGGSSGGSCPIAITRYLHIGSRDKATGGQVTMLQKFLVEQGLLNPDNVTGYYGSATEKAVQAFQNQYNLVQIKNRSAGYGWAGPITRAKIKEVCARVVPPLPTPIQIISPAGGEVWQKGSIQKIAWEEFSTGGCVIGSTQPCPLPGTADTPTVMAYPYYAYDIYLTSAPIVCVTTPCPVAPSFRFTIAKGVPGNSYSWTVGTIINAAADEGVRDGTYSIRVQRVGQDVGTQSNAFTINSTPQENALLFIDPASLNLTAGQSKQVRAFYQPPMPPCPSGVVCDQVLPLPYEVDARWFSSNPTVVDFEYAVPPCQVGVVCSVRTQVFAVGKGMGIATIKAVYTLASGVVLTTTANVAVGQTSVPSITVLSPNGGEVWRAGSIQTVRWSGGDPSWTVAIDIRSTPTSQGVYTSPNISNSGSYMFTVPPTIPLGTYYAYVVCQSCAVGTAGAGDWSNAPFTIIAPGSNLPPIISGVSGPTTLKIGEAGTWNITASDPENGALSYSVVWGDEAIVASPAQTFIANTSVQQIATFTHAYARAGNYVPLFSVTDNVGNVAKSSITVTVGSPVALPDLVVQRIHDDNGRLSVTIGNIGAGQAPSGVDLSIWIDGERKWTYNLDTINDQSFRSPGGASVIRPQTLSGQHTIIATIDSNGIVAEPNEDNNRLEKTITFGGLSVKVFGDIAQPPATLAVRGSVVPFASIIVSPSESVALQSFTVRRRGLASDFAFKEIVLIRDFGAANSGANYVVARGELNPSTHEAILTSSIAIHGPATFTVAGVMANDLALYAGQVVSLEVINGTFASYSDGGNVVTVPLSIISVSHTINNSLQIGSVVVIKSIAGGILPARRYFTFSNSSIEDVLLYNIVLTDVGGSILVNGMQKPCTPLNDGTTREQCYFKEALVIRRGDALTVETNATLEDGRDIRITGATYGYHIMPVLQ